MTGKTMFRVKKDKNNPYVMLNKEFLQDDNGLSWKAKGILAYLLSLPDDWQIYESEVAKHGSDGRHSFRSGMQELIRYGYIKRERIRDDKGMLRAYQYNVYEVPSRVRKPDVGLSDIGKPDTTNNDLTDNDSTNNYNNENDKGQNLRSDYHPLKEYAKDIVREYVYTYKEILDKDHPRLRREQLERVAGVIADFDENSPWQPVDWGAMIDKHFERGMATDYNVNHFATWGVLENIRYEIGFEE